MSTRRRVEERIEKAIARLNRVGERYCGDVDPAKNLPGALVAELLEIQATLFMALEQIQEDGR
jgi:hypothetical protein